MANCEDIAYRTGFDEATIKKDILRMLQIGIISLNQLSPELYETPSTYKITIKATNNQPEEKVVTCKNCGATTEVKPKGTTYCEYCGSVLK